MTGRPSSSFFRNTDTDHPSLYEAKPLGPLRSPRRGADATGGATLRPTIVTNPSETLTSRRLARSSNMDLLALDRSIPQGHLIDKRCDQRAFIETKTHQIYNNATASRTIRLIGHEPLGSKKLRDQDFRQSRRRDFDADNYHPQSRAFGTRPRFNRTPFEAPSGPPVQGVVKWFNPEKGFGFVELSDGSGDAFLHGNVLAQSGINAAQPGETSKSASVLVTRDHTSPRSSASIAALLNRRHHGERISGRRHRTGHLRA